MMPNLFHVLPLSLVACFFCPAPAVEMEGGAASAAALLPMGPELVLDRFASFFEDLANALVSIENQQDARLSASRVAVDFLNLAEMNDEVMALKGNSLNADFARSFATRCAESRKTVSVAIERLKTNACYDSPSLVAALALGGLLDNRLTPAQAAECAAELMVNVQETTLCLLQQVRDRDSADKVAEMLRVTRANGRMIEAFAARCRGQETDPHLQMARSVRSEQAAAALSNMMDKLQENKYYGSASLQKLLAPQL